MSKEKLFEGVHAPPQFVHALGLTEEEQKRPLIGIVSSYNEICWGISTLIKSWMRLKSALRWPAEHNRFPCNRRLRRYMGHTE